MNVENSEKEGDGVKSEELTDQKLEAREEALRLRMERIHALESEILQKEKTIKAKENAKKSIILRLPPSLHDQIANWAQEDFRSINGQIEYLLSRAVFEKYGRD